MMNIFKTALSASAGLALLVPCAAEAAPLTVVDVGAPAINCVFNVTCTITVTDSVGNFTLPLDSGTGRLQSRSFTSSAGAPAYPLNGYMYRVDMTQMQGTTAKNCVSQLRVDFGPVATVNYKPGTPSQVFVVTSGGLGSVGVASADLTGTTLNLNLSGGGVCPGQTTYFIGLAAKTAPASVSAMVRPTLSSAMTPVDARGPAH